MKATALQITVFDFSSQDCLHTVRILEKFFKNQNISAQVRGFTKLQVFLSDAEKQANQGRFYDMAFVGVDNMMGVEAARHIRELDTGLPLFLVSGANDFGMEGFRLQVLDYLIKPLSLKTVKEAVARITMKCFSGHRIPMRLCESGGDI